jgi:hypothetical protein
VNLESVRWLAGHTLGQGGHTLCGKRRYAHVQNGPAQRLDREAPSVASGKMLAGMATLSCRTLARGRYTLLICIWLTESLTRPEAHNGKHVR